MRIFLDGFLLWGDRMDMNITWLNIDQVKPYEKNAKKHPDEQVKWIANSLQRFGWKQPLVIDKDGVVVVGHGRLLAAKQIGMDTVPCIYADDLTEEEIKAYRLADNKTNESEWDDELLELELDELEELPDIDMSDFGFELSDGGAESAEVSDDNYDGIVPEEPRAKVGDIYRLGNHRLICGDSTDKAVIDRLMNGVKAELCLTDPPYGINAVHKDGKVHGDSKDAIAERKIYHPIIGDDTTETARRNYEIIRNISKNQVIFGGNYFTDFLPVSRCWVVWDKKNGEGSFSDAELAWTSFDRVVKLYSFMWNGLFREGKRDEELITRVHPTQKPVGMLAMILNDFTEEDDSVLDCFGGSGSTLIACEQLNRNCYMCELDPHYIDVIIDRWEKFTGKKAELIDRM